MATLLRGVEFALEALEHVEGQREAGPGRGFGGQRTERLPLRHSSRNDLVLADLGLSKNLGERSAG